MQLEHQHAHLRARCGEQPALNRTAGSETDGCRSDEDASKIDYSERLREMQEQARASSPICSLAATVIGAVLMACTAF